MINSQIDILNFLFETIVLAHKLGKQELKAEIFILISMFAGLGDNIDGEPVGFEKQEADPVVI